MRATPVLCRYSVELGEPAVVEPARGGALAMSVVHDLRSPLAAIHAGAQLLIGATLRDQDISRVARNIFEATNRIQEMLQDYVESLRTSELGARGANVREAAAQAIERFAAAAELQAVSIAREVAAELVVAAARSRVVSVLANLLGNALDAMPNGGRVCVSARKEASGVVIRVADTGPGIAPEVRDSLFEPLAPPFKPNGWGVGLAHARQVVREDGGEIWLEFSSPRGACFAFRLPAR